MMLLKMFIKTAHGKCLLDCGSVARERLVRIWHDYGSAESLDIEERLDLQCQSVRGRYSTPNNPAMPSLSKYLNTLIHLTWLHTLFTRRSKIDSRWVYLQSELLIGLSKRSCERVDSRLTDVGWKGKEYKGLRWKGKQFPPWMTHPNLRRSSSTLPNICPSLILFYYGRISRRTSVWFQAYKYI